MPLVAVMLVQHEHPITEKELVPLRKAFCSDLNLDPESDFYYGKPLALVPDPNSDFDFLSINGQPFTMPESVFCVNVNTLKAYYGKGYERGDFPHFVRMAVWLETRLPGCLLWYGMDSDRVLRPFNESGRAELVAYFDEFGWEPYKRHWKEYRAMRERERENTPAKRFRRWLRSMLPKTTEEKPPQ